MQDLSSKLFSLMNLPLMESPIYLSSSGNVISASQFTPAEQYYSATVPIRKMPTRTGCRFCKMPKRRGAFSA